MNQDARILMREESVHFKRDREKECMTFPNRVDFAFLMNKIQCKQKIKKKFIDRMEQFKYRKQIDQRNVVEIKAYLHANAENYWGKKERAVIPTHSFTSTPYIIINIYNNLDHSIYFMHIHQPS